MYKKYVIVPIICLAVVFAGITSMAAGDKELMTVDGKQVYLVKPGDTLSGIAAKVFGDYMRWKDLLKVNPQIKKASLIFPGDTVIVVEAPAEVGISLKEKAAEAHVEKAEMPTPIAPEELLEALREEAEPVVAFKPVSFAEPTGIPQTLYESCGFITVELPQAAVIGSPEGKMALSSFDTVFINQGDADGLTVGQEFRVLRPVREIIHPTTAVSMGWLIKVVGRLRTECLQQNTAIARITHSYDYIAEGDRLEPHTPVALPSDHYLSPKLTGPCVPSQGGKESLILASQDDKSIISEGDIVFLDKGLASGIIPGTRFAIFRQDSLNQGQGKYLVGELQVLLSQNYTSSALVTNSVYPVSIEDGIVAW